MELQMKSWIHAHKGALPRPIAMAAVWLAFGVIAYGESFFEEVAPNSTSIISVSTRKQGDLIEFTVVFPRKNPGKVTLCIKDREKRKLFDGEVALREKPDTFFAVFTVSRKYLEHSRCDVPIEIDGGRGHAYYHFMLSSFVKPESNTKGEK
jgi:hypothetical protein